MYESFFAFSDRPFSIAPDPRFLFLSERHREALAHLVYGLNDAGGFVMLTGEVGTGKTTLCRSLLAQVPPMVDVAFVLNPRLDAIELLETICDELRIDTAAARGSAKQLIDRINAHLLASNASGRSTVLLIDEAQNLATDVLEQLRLLTNLETNERKLLRIILIGQPELAEQLARPDLRQLAQRITARYHLEALTASDTVAYVEHRLQVAGAKHTLFTAPSLKTLHRAAGGIPRLINVIADRALLGAYAGGKREITPQMVRKAAGEITGDERRRPWPTWMTAAVTAALMMLAGGGAWAVLDTRNTARTPVATGPLAMPNAVAPAAAALRAQTEYDAPASASQSPTEAAYSAGMRDAGLTNRSDAQSGGVLGSASMDPGVGDAIVPPAGTAPADEAPLLIEPPASAMPRRDDASAVNPPSGNLPAGNLPAGNLPAGNVPAARLQTDSVGELRQSAAAAAVVLRAQLPAWPSYVPKSESSERAFATLFSRWRSPFDAVAGQTPCDYAKKVGLACLSGVTHWAELSALNRPAVLQLQDDNQQTYSVALVGLQGNTAEIVMGERTFRVPMASIDRSWRGEYTLLWQLPPQYRGPIGTGDKGPDVAWLREQLQSITQVPIAGTVGDHFDASLAKRLRGWQAGQHLVADGRAGPRTWIALHDASGMAAPRLLDRSQRAQRPIVVETADDRRPPPRGRTAPHVRASEPG